MDSGFRCLGVIQHGLGLPIAGMGWTMDEDVCGPRQWARDGFAWEARPLGLNGR